MGLLVCQHWCFLFFLAASLLSPILFFLPFSFSFFMQQLCALIMMVWLVFEVCDFAFCFVSVVVL